MGHRWLIAGGCIFGLSFVASLIVSRNPQKAVVTGAIATVSAASVLLIEKFQKQPSTPSAQLEQLIQQRESIRQAIELLNRRHCILDGQRHELEQRIAALESRQKSLQNDIDELEQKKAELYQQVQTRQEQVQALSFQEQELQHRTQQVQDEINRLEQQRQALGAQVEYLENQRQTLLLRRQELAEQRQHLEQDVQALRQAKEDLNCELNLLASQGQDLQQQIQSARDELSNLHEQKSQLNHQIETLRDEIEVLKQRQRELETSKLQCQEELDTLTARQDELRRTLEQLQAQCQRVLQEDALHSEGKESSPPQEQGLELGVPAPSQTTTVTVDRQLTSISSKVRKFVPLVPPKEFRLSNVEHTEWLWEDVLWPRCTKKDPLFLGSICLPKKDTDETWGTKTILSIVGSELKRFGENNIRYDHLHERCGDEENLYWLKIITFAFVEYAYYMDSDEEDYENRFWEGLCKRLDIPSQQKMQNSLREIARQGIKKLKLPIAEDGYEVVSTLWLQSGIPRHNLHHFADVIVDLGAELNWQQIRDYDTLSLAQKLLDICRDRYPSRRLLKRFLEYSCRPGMEPISGEILQDIARVAVVLREHGKQPEILLDDAQRQEFIVTEKIEFKFFVRDWDAVVRILSPERPGRNWLTIQRRPLTLWLDVETLNIQLVLPEQYLQHINWSPGVCFIPQVNWQGRIDPSGKVTIPELTQTLQHIPEKWVWQLTDDQGRELLCWEVNGISSNFPALIFDAWTGEYLQSQPSIAGATEIFCFTQEGNEIHPGVAVEVIDAHVPCSISGWYGKRLKLTAQFGELEFSFGKVEWRLSPIDACLRGLSLPRQRFSYLEVPTLWYLRRPEETELVLAIETPASDTPFEKRLTDFHSNDWLPINLDEWIKQPGQYRVSLRDWSQAFDVKASYEIREEHVAEFPEVAILRRQGVDCVRINQLPLELDGSHQLWSETLIITGLWPLEPVDLLLDCSVCQTRQADKNGQLTVELASLRDLLPSATRLDYRRSGQSPQALVFLRQITWEWQDKALLLKGLNPHSDYKLIGWNLLRPHEAQVAISIPEGSQVTISLENINPGIYYWQIDDAEKVVKAIGWWCGYKQYDFSISPDENKNLTEFCYAILDHSLLNEFQKVALKLDWDRNWIQGVLRSLQRREFFFPEWLDANALIAKLQAILEPRQGDWYKVGVETGKRGDFRRDLLDRIRQDNLWSIILDFQRHPDKNQRDIALVKVSPSDMEVALDCLRSTSGFAWMSRQPLTPDEIAELLPDENCHG
ncbi:MAG: hypothetical protein RMI89_02925 [Gloeomargarita sp. SKYBB_i_bin120]|nr:hypothetical protein [Gloeomargarita sp. SKYB120]MDW8177474.1 hypothetical protein [Gloeomargarita sp. SKYBB_i_bin120]